MFKRDAKVWIDLPLNLISNPNHDSSRPERVEAPAIVADDEPRETTRRNKRTGREFPVTLISVISLRPRLDGTTWLAQTWEPEQFMYLRQATASNPDATKIEGIDHIGGEVLSIEKLNELRRTQPGPVTFVPGLTLAEAQALTGVTPAPQVIAPPVVEDDAEARAAKAAFDAAMGTPTIELPPVEAKATKPAK